MSTVSQGKCDLHKVVAPPYNRYSVNLSGFTFTVQFPIVPTFSYYQIYENAINAAINVGIEMPCFIEGQREILVFLPLIGLGLL